MQLQSLFVLLAASCSNIVSSNARSGVPMEFSSSQTELPQSTTRASMLDMPTGFNPQPPPMNPLLYPFVMEQTNGVTISTTPGWKPIVNPILSMRSTTFIPLLQQRRSAVPTERTAVEPIVYGNWKPHHTPLQPDDILDLSQHMPALNATRRRSATGVGEAILRGHYDQVLPSYRNMEKSGTQGSDAPLLEGRHGTTNHRNVPKWQHGRRKIPTQTSETRESSIEMVKINTTAPHSPDRPNQANNPFETIETPNSTEADAWIQKSSNVDPKFATTFAQQSTTTPTPKRWPTGFMTTQKTTNSTHDPQADTSEPPQALNSMDMPIPVPVELLPYIPPNITQVGVPYEDKNSAEEPRICVPLTVREKSLTETVEIVEVERVYCFPLPLDENDGNATLYGNAHSGCMKTGSRIVLMALLLLIIRLL